MDDEDTGVALRASYELLVLTERHDAKLPRHGRGAFFELFRERTQLQPPGWWSRALLADQAIDGFGPGVVPMLNPPPDVSTGDGIVPIHLDQPQIAKLGLTQYALVPASVTPNRAFSTPYCVVRQRCPLVCCDLERCRRVWTSEVWALANMYRWGSAFVGPVPSGIDIVVHDNDVIVWGADVHGAYVEVFDATTGAARYRFDGVRR
jgi:hypothetical protein